MSLPTGQVAFEILLRGREESEAPAAAVDFI